MLAWLALMVRLAAVGVGQGLLLGQLQSRITADVVSMG